MSIKNKAVRTIQKYVRAKQHNNLLKNWNKKIKKRSEWIENDNHLSKHLFSLPKTLIRGHSCIKTSKHIKLLDDQFIIMFSPTGCAFSFDLPFAELMNYASSNEGLRILIDSLLISSNNYAKSLGVRVYTPYSSIPDQEISYVHNNPQRTELIGKINLPNRNIMNRLKTNGSISNISSQSLSDIISSKPGIYFIHTCRSFKCMTNPSSKIRKVILKDKSEIPYPKENKPNTLLRKPNRLSFYHRQGIQNRISHYDKLLNMYQDIINKFYLSRERKNELDSQLIEIQKMEYYIRNPDKLIEYIIYYHLKFGRSTNIYFKNLNTAISNYQKLIQKFPKHKGLLKMNKSFQIMRNQKYVNFQSVNELKIIRNKQKQLLSIKV